MNGGRCPRRIERVVMCGEKAQVWQRTIGEEAWSLIPGVNDVRALQALNGCWLVATTRTILRLCGQGSIK